MTEVHILAIDLVVREERITRWFSVLHGRRCSFVLFLAPDGRQQKVPFRTVNQPFGKPQKCVAKSGKSWPCQLDVSIGQIKLTLDPFMISLAP